MKKRTTTISQGEGLERSQTDWSRLDAMSDEDIDTSDIPELTREFWDNAQLVIPASKTHLSVRIDDEVLEWFRAQGPGYQTRMNAVLRSYYEAHRDQKRRQG